MAMCSCAIISYIWAIRKNRAIKMERCNNVIWTYSCVQGWPWHFGLHRTTVKHNTCDLFGGHTMNFEDHNRLLDSQQSAWKKVTFSYIQVLCLLLSFRKISHSTDWLSILTMPTMSDGQSVPGNHPRYSSVMAFRHKLQCTSWLPFQQIVTEIVVL